MIYYYYSAKHKVIIESLRFHIIYSFTSTDHHLCSSGLYTFLLDFYFIDLSGRLSLYKLRYMVGFVIVEMAISTNPKLS